MAPRWTGRWSSASANRFCTCMESIRTTTSVPTFVWSWARYDTRKIVSGPILRPSIGANGAQHSVRWSQLEAATTWAACRRRSGDDHYEPPRPHAAAAAGARLRSREAQGALSLVHDMSRRRRAKGRVALARSGRMRDLPRRDNREGGGMASANFTTPDQPPL